MMEPTIAGKWLELLKEIAPRVSRVAMLFNPATAPYAEYWLNAFNAAAVSSAVEAIGEPVRDTSELEPVIAALPRAPNGGLIVMPDTFMVAHRAEVTSLAARYPSYHLCVAFLPELGALLSYGRDRQFSAAVSYADRILRGAKPSELPVQAPVKFELVINLKTAKALGLDVPWILQQRADPETGALHSRSGRVGYAAFEGLAWTTLGFAPPIGSEGAGQRPRHRARPTDRSGKAGRRRAPSKSNSRSCRLGRLEKCFPGWEGSYGKGFEKIGPS